MTAIDDLQKFLMNACLTRGETLAITVHNGTFTIDVGVLYDVLDAAKRSDTLRNALANIMPYAEAHQDAGPDGEGWKSDQLMQAIKIAEDVLKKGC
jgi:hypothetical protein